jgi:hypothetical protein
LKNSIISVIDSNRRFFAIPPKGYCVGP